MCDDAATFERLRDVPHRETRAGVTINLPPAPVRAVSVELAKHADPAAVGWGARLRALGCVVALVTVGGVFVAGLLTIAGWVRG